MWQDMYAGSAGPMLEAQYFGGYLWSNRLVAALYTVLMNPAPLDDCAVISNPNIRVKGLPSQRTAVVQLLGVHLN